MNTVQRLVLDVSVARLKYFDQIVNITDEQGLWKSDPETWNISEITEHLFWAEQGGLFGMWKTLHSIRSGDMVRTYESPHKDMPIEQVIAITWQAEEKVPAVAAPRLGGPLSFWKPLLNSLQQVLEIFSQDLKEDELKLLAHPHPISGPVDFQQRIEFIRFHINRHKEQVSRILKAMNP